MNLLFPHFVILSELCFKIDRFGKIMQFGFWFTVQFKALILTDLLK
jgi:hypothetical protein